MQLSVQHSFKTTKDRRNTPEDIPRNRSQQHVPTDPFQTLYTIICTYRMCIEYLLGPVLKKKISIALDAMKDEGHLAIQH
jgi:hypothetical protein